MPASIVGSESMLRMACICMPSLELQVLLRGHPEWGGLPVAVVDRDAASGVVLWVNRAAREAGITPGVRYAAALSLSDGLRAGTAPESAVQEAVRLVLRRLWSFSPRVEPSAEQAGVFWADCSGLGRLYPDLGEWAREVQAALAELDYTAGVAVGFSRFGSFAAARSSTAARVFESPAEERAHARVVRIERLNFPPRTRDLLHQLGIRTLGQFAALPPEGILKRFGAEAHDIHQLAQAHRWESFNAAAYEEPIESVLPLDFPETSTERLLAAIEGLLHEAFDELHTRHEAMASLCITLTLDNGESREETLSPANPADAPGEVLPLIKLRLESLALRAGVAELGLRAEGIERNPEQFSLFPGMQERNRSAVQSAFARIRASCGNDALVCAELHEAHLPEAGYSWQPVEELRMPRPKPTDCPRIVRRIYTPAIPLAHRARHEPDGWLIARLEDGPVDEIMGPYAVSGGWWVRTVSREYYYLRTRSGRWLWVFFDARRRRWYLQGEVQ